MSSTHPEPSASGPTGRLAAALATLTPSALCTLCVIELKQARNARRPDPEVHPGVVMAGVVINGVPSTMMLCEVRHPLNVGAPPPPSLLIAPADALPSGRLA
jgi:hypothetical protein